MVSKVRQQAQVTNSSTKPASTQPQKKGNIVIEFSSLPKKLKTKEVREFYDKDKSGLLESNNWNGQNEVALMAKAFGLDLSKYASKDIVKTVNDHGTRCYNANGKLTHVYFDTNLWEAGNNTPYSKYDYKFTRGYSEDDYSLRYEQKWVKNGSEVEAVGYDKHGNTIRTTDTCKTATIYDSENKEIAKLTKNKDNNRYKARIFNGNKVELVKGQNTLVQAQDIEIESLSVMDYLYGGENFDTENLLKTAKKQKPVGEIKYLYNGEPVQAKSIGKGRYEITLQDGSIKYIAHNGIKLKPEYVRNNP